MSSSSTFTSRMGHERRDAITPFAPRRGEVLCEAVRPFIQFAIRNDGSRGAVDHGGTIVHGAGLGGYVLGVAWIIVESNDYARAVRAVIRAASTGVTRMHSDAASMNRLVTIIGIS